MLIKATVSYGFMMSLAHNRGLALYCIFPSLSLMKIFYNKNITKNNSAN